MNDKENKKNEQKDEEKYEGKTYAYIAMGLMAATALFFGLSFTVMGIYSLIASILFSLTSITFLKIQKNKNDFKWLFYLTVGAYILFAIVFLFFAGGIIYSA